MGNEKVLVTWKLGHQKPMLVDFKDLCLFWDVKRSQFRKGQIVAKKGTDAIGVVQNKCFWTGFWRVRVKWLTGKNKGTSKKIRNWNLYIPLSTGTPVRPQEL